MSDLTTSFHAFAQPLKSKVTQLTEKSLLYQHYPTLKKATNSELGDTPGYVYEELVQLTYSDLTMATQLAIYLADCLGTIHILLRKQFYSTKLNLTTYLIFHKNSFFLSKQKDFFFNITF